MDKNLPVSLEYAASSFVYKVYDQLKLIFSQKIIFVVLEYKRLLQ